MNIPLNHLSAMALFTLAGSVAFAQTANITVKGQIIPGSCTPVISGAGVFDFGTMQISAIGNVAGASNMPAGNLEKTQTLTVTCTADTSFAMNLTDSRAGTLPLTLPAGTHYGLGGTTPYGGYQVMLENPLVTTAAIPAATGASLLGSADGKTAWTLPTAAIFMPAGGTGANVYLSPAVSGATALLAVSTMTATLSVKPALLPEAQLTPLVASGNLTFDGAATLEITYP